MNPISGIGWIQTSILLVKKVLDIGAGEAVYTRFIAERFNPEIIIACELFPQRMYPSAKENINSKLNFVSGNCFSLPFSTGAFDVVFGSLVLHQLPNLSLAISEIKRVLNNTGCYIGIEINHYHPVHLYNYYLGRHSANQYFFTVKDLLLFNDASFEIKIRYFYGRIPWMHNRLLSTTIGIIARKI